jgi:hypothetical protein
LDSLKKELNFRHVLPTCSSWPTYREVRRCFKCQRYGHIQRDCPAKFAACGKCAERRRANEWTSTVLKCVNCRSPQQSGHTTCAEQVKAIN